MALCYLMASVAIAAIVLLKSLEGVRRCFMGGASWSLLLPEGRVEARWKQKQR